MRPAPRTALFVEIMVAYLLASKSHASSNPAKEIGEAHDTVASAFGYRLEKPREEFIDVLGETSIMFILAHEYSHVILGHLNSASARLNVGSVNVTSVSRSHANELDADNLGLELTLRCNQSTGYNLTTSYLGVDFAFSCFTILEDALGISASESHPPSEKRRAALRDTLIARFGEAASETVELSKYIQEVLDTLWRRLGGSVRKRVAEASN